MGLDAGSGRPGVPKKLADFTIAGVATRSISYSGPPLEADWGPEGAPTGTIVLESDGILWIKFPTVGWLSMVFG